MAIHCFLWRGVFNFSFNDMQEFFGFFFIIYFFGVCHVFFLFTVWTCNPQSYLFRRKFCRENIQEYLQVHVRISFHKFFFLFQERKCKDLVIFIQIWKSRKFFFARSLSTYIISNDVERNHCISVSIFSVWLVLPIN